MGLKEEFNVSTESGAFHKSNDVQLTYSSGTYEKHNYNFLSRTMTTIAQSGGIAISVIPFSQLDRETLEFMRDKLVELGGKPPALVPEPVSGALDHDMRATKPLRLK